MGFVLVAVFWFWSGSRSKVSRKGKVAPKRKFTGTDGMENASHRYNYAKIKKMIEKRQAKNWEFIFLGANIDAVAEAGRMGIRAGRAVNYHCDAAGTALNYKVLSQTVAMMRSCESAQDMTNFLDEEDCFEEIEEDYVRRK